MAAAVSCTSSLAWKVNDNVVETSKKARNGASRSLSTSWAGTPVKTGPLKAVSGSTSLHHRGLSSPGTSTKSTTIQCVSVSDVSQIKAVSEDLPLKEIPGGYGLPFIGAIIDRLDFFWFHPVEKFYANKRDKYKSTVFRSNMPPGPPFFPDPRVVVVLDEKSYPVLFDVSKVEKKDVFVGTFRPSLKLTGGDRVLSYLDPSEEKHRQVKQWAFEILKGAGPRVFPQFASDIAGVFEKWEAAIKKDGKVAWVADSRTGTYNFILKSYTGRGPYEAGPNSLGTEAPSKTLLWLLANIAPISAVPVPWFLAPIVELLLHTFPIPPFLVQGIHTSHENFFRTYASELLDIAEKEIGLDREEALQNLIFLTVFNSWGGIDVFFPKVMSRLGAAGAEYQKELAAEVRKAVKDNGGLGPKALAAMPLVESAVYEVMRIDPPVPFQYGRAKTDLIIESHDAAFQIKKGEMIHGFMPIATRDPKIFDDAETFVPKRFLGEEGKALLKYVLWSNGPQTESPTTENKHCAGKNFVLLVGQLFVATLFNTYDILEVDAAGTTITNLKKAAA